jgi:hypothetical protein
MCTHTHTRTHTCTCTLTTGARQTHAEAASYLLADVCEQPVRGLPLNIERVHIFGAEATAVVTVGDVTEDASVDELGVLAVCPRSLRLSPRGAVAGTAAVAPSRGWPSRSAQHLTRHALVRKKRDGVLERQVCGQSVCIGCSRGQHT